MDSNNNNDTFDKWFSRFDTSLGLLPNNNNSDNSSSNDNNDITNNIRSVIDIETSTVPSWLNKSRSKLKDVYYSATPNETKDSLAHIKIPNMLHDCGRYASYITITITITATNTNIKLLESVDLIIFLLIIFVYQLELLSILIPNLI